MLQRYGVAHSFNFTLFILNRVMYSTITITVAIRRVTVTNNTIPSKLNHLKAKASRTIHRTITTIDIKHYKSIQRSAHLLQMQNLLFNSALPILNLRIMLAYRRIEVQSQRNLKGDLVMPLLQNFGSAPNAFRKVNSLC